MPLTWFSKKRKISIIFSKSTKKVRKKEILNWELGQLVSNKRVLHEDFLWST